MKTPRLSPSLFAAALLAAAAGCSEDVTTGAGDQKDRRESLHEGRDGASPQPTDTSAAASSGTADNSAAVGSGVDSQGGGATGVADPAEGAASAGTSDNATTEDAAGTDPGDN